MPYRLVTREERRKLFPEIADMYRQFAEVFGPDCVVLEAREGENEMKVIDGKYQVRRGDND